MKIEAKTRLQASTVVTALQVSDVSTFLKSVGAPAPLIKDVTTNIIQDSRRAFKSEISKENAISLSKVLVKRLGAPSKELGKGGRGAARQVWALGRLGKVVLKIDPTTETSTFFFAI